MMWVEEIETLPRSGLESIQLKRLQALVPIPAGSCRPQPRRDDELSSNDKSRSFHEESCISPAFRKDGPRRAWS